MTYEIRPATKTSDARVAFVAKSATRAKNAPFLSIGTPAEFFATSRPLLDLCKCLARRFAARQNFYSRSDAFQDIAVVVLECRQRWTPDHGVPFGGFAYRSAMLWCTGAMYKASVPVSGPLDSRAEVEAIGYSSLDAPVGGDEERAPLGAVLSDADVDTGAPTTRPDARLESREEGAALRAACFDLTDEAFDAVLAVLHGADDVEPPTGYSAEGLRRLADRVRADLSQNLAARRGTPARRASRPTSTPAAPAFDPWAAL